MNKELAKVLRDRLNGNLSFVDKYAGLVQTVEFKQEQDGGMGVRKRMPVTVESVIEGTCANYEVQMIPDSNNIGILYFEDGATIPNGRKYNRYNYTSYLTLVCWINKSRFKTNIYEEISAMAINEVIVKLRAEQNPENVSFFTGLFVEISRIPKQDAALFSKYTYDETLTQYLRPPFEFFGIELKCSYTINPQCIGNIEIDRTCYDGEEPQEKEIPENENPEFENIEL